MHHRRISSLAYGVLVATLLAAPALLTSSWSTDAMQTSVIQDAETTRLIDRVLAVEGWASEGFAGLSQEFHSRIDPPDWEGIRRIMEQRGCIDLRYALTIRLRMVDGGLDERTLVRRPYSEPQHADEFLRYLKSGPDAAVWAGPGDPPWLSERGAEESVSVGFASSPDNSRPELAVTPDSASRRLDEHR